MYELIIIGDINPKSNLLVSTHSDVVKDTSPYLGNVCICSHNTSTLARSTHAHTHTHTHTQLQCTNAYIHYTVGKIFCVKFIAIASCMFNMSLHVIHEIFSQQNLLYMHKSTDQVTVINY